MKKRHFEIAGWLLFIVSALGFTIASISSFWGLFGSLFFLVACLVFLVPYFMNDD
ncbi:MAG: cytochrome oxidase subunit III [Geminicoccus sp.]|nr:cytochrome oxidase subunit III [Geminicoccus sp.]